MFTVLSGSGRCVVSGWDVMVCQPRPSASGPLMRSQGSRRGSQIWVVLAGVRARVLCVSVQATRYMCRHRPSASGPLMLSQGSRRGSQIRVVLVGVSAVCVHSGGSVRVVGAAPLVVWRCSCFATSAGRETLPGRADCGDLGIMDCNTDSRVQSRRYARRPKGYHGTRDDREETCVG